MWHARERKKKVQITGCKAEGNNLENLRRNRNSIRISVK
jgi:hypothetical protein